MTFDKTKPYAFVDGSFNAEKKYLRLGWNLTRK